MPQRTSSPSSLSHKPRPALVAPSSTTNRAKRWLFTALLAVVAGGFIWLAALQSQRRLTTQGVRVVKAYPHDRSAWSQGLVFDDDGTLLEGTGTYGQSSLRRVELETGRVIEKIDLDARFFGEGITALGDHIYQLTWKEKTGLIYDRATLREVGRFRLDGEGWGLTSDGTQLIVSDGSSTLSFVDAKTFAVVRRVAVTSGARAVPHLNELEYVEGEIFANVWHQDYIVRIDPTTGKVSGTIDLTNVYPRRQRTHREHVLNGIAYDAKNKRLFVTGKNWPKLYEIELLAPRR